MGSWAPYAYLVAAVLFILGIKGLGSAKTARAGNVMAAAGMLVAIIATLSLARVVTYELIVAGVAIGGVIGAVAARRIEMTAMPEMVALLNGFGGAASALVGMSEYLHRQGVPFEGTSMVSVAIVLSLLIGSLTLTGSLIAFSKLRGLLSSQPVTYSGQQIANALILLAALGLGFALASSPFSGLLMFGVVLVALALGVLAVLPIGGGDMPVVISLLNSYSGLAACATGFVLGNGGLIVSGSLVGASGLVLTKQMCEGMNRSLTNVLFSAFGKPVERSAGEAEDRTVRSCTVEDAAIIFSSAQRCVMVPGYGLAVAQAQHAAQELAETLEERGIRVSYAIHPVAGRMPGHMNVLLAEASVPYEQLVEMDDINPEFSETDVALVIGANDVVNPAARKDEASPIYGMPILDVDYARHVFVIKRSMNPGFAGIENPLFYNENTMMLFGDAKSVLLDLVAATKDS
jgi:NAD(P) transhydrogenase subunit beta